HSISAGRTMCECWSAATGCFGVTASMAVSLEGSRAAIIADRAATGIGARQRQRKRGKEHYSRCAEITFFASVVLRVIVEHATAMCAACVRGVISLRAAAAVWQNEPNAERPMISVARAAARRRTILAERTQRDNGRNFNRFDRLVRQAKRS